MREIRTIAVIGAGRLGRGIAHLAVLGGYRTILEDILPAALRRAEDEIRTNLGKAVENGKVRAEEADAALNRLEFATLLEDAARAADLVIEAVPEEFDSKEEIFRLLDRICRPGTVLASNTSSLSVTEIAAVTERPQNVVGLHFASSEGEMSLIEVIRGAQTDDPTFEAAVSVGRRIGKGTVAIRHASEMSRVAEP